MTLYIYGVNNNIPMVGICRGAQFLNVMCGGSLYQDVDKHNQDHVAHKPDSLEEVMVTSVHHQMMIPSKEGEVLLEASVSTYKVRMPDSHHLSLSVEDYTDTKSSASNTSDVEAVYYKEEGCFCYQPHPEYVTKGHDCYDVFFEFLETKLGVKA